MVVHVSPVVGAKPTHFWSTCLPATNRHSLQISTIPPRICATIVWIHYIPIWLRLLFPNSTAGGGRALPQEKYMTWIVTSWWQKNVWHNVDWWKPRVKIINPSNNYTCKMYAGYNIGLTLRASKLWLDLAWPAVWTVTFLAHISGRNYRRMIRHPWSWWNLSTKAIVGACSAFQLGILEAHTKKRMIPENIGLAMICIMNRKCGQRNGSMVARIGLTQFKRQWV